MEYGDIYSVALVFQLRAIDKKRLKGKIGHLADKYISRICRHN